MMISGCATAPKMPAAVPLPESGGIYHTVKGGETLWGISQMYGIDLDRLVKINRISDSDIIEKGQVIAIPLAGEKVVERPYRPVGVHESFIWPVRGYIISAYGSKIDRIVNKGIDIRSREGANVIAARSGRVVYSDSRLKGFGHTVIIDHGNNLQTVYSYNSEILVKAGDTVSQYDTIAKAGKTGRAKEASLHFEIRKDGEPRNPLYYLPR